MSKNKSDQNEPNSSNMLGDKTGSMLDKKTHEDFNNEHPNQIDPDFNKLKKKPEKITNEVINNKSKDDK